MLKPPPSLRAQWGMVARFINASISDLNFRLELNAWIDWFFMAALPRARVISRCCTWRWRDCRFPSARSTSRPACRERLKIWRSTAGGVVPSLRHRGLTILQSNVILDYLARETGHFEGRTEQQRWQAREWLSWEADHITYVAKVRHSARFRASHPETIAEFRPRAEAALSFVDKTVKDQPFLVGDNCTIADIGCWGRMVFMSEGGFEIANWPHLEAWAGRLKAMPGFALPYDLIPSKDREFDPV